MTSPSLFVAITDLNWFRFLRERAPLDEANFWRPSGKVWNLPPGTPLIFKTRSPDHRVVGGGYIGMAQSMRLREAWEFFGEKNGTSTIGNLLALIQRHSGSERVTVDKVIGCMVLQQPFFLRDDQAFHAPEGWSAKNTPGFKVPANDPFGEAVWQQLIKAEQFAISSRMSAFGGLGDGRIVRPRLGQGTFRSLVLQAYGNQCAVSREHSLPVLEAAHIVDFSAEQIHSLDNGIALRSDIHRLFDRGYVSITPEMTFVVSKKLHENFNNGKAYYQFDGQRIVVPRDPELRPKADYLAWHLSERFRDSLT